MVNEYFFLKKMIMITLEKKNHLRKYVIRLKKKKTQLEQTRDYMINM
jgi:hypothetical protein